MWRYLLALALLIFPSPVNAVEFTIFEPNIINNEITLNAEIISSSKYYLQGILQSIGSSYYFGQTQNNQDLWIDYLGSPEKEYIIDNFFSTEPIEASWSGKLKLKFSADDKNYLGPGEYNLKLNRYTGNSSSPAGVSNTLTITLSVARPTPEPTPTPTPQPSPTPVSSAIASETADPTPTPSPSSPPSPKPSLTTSPEGTVAGLTINSINLPEIPSPSPSLNLQGQALKGPSLNLERARIALTTGTGLILLSIASYLGYKKYRNSQL